MSTSINAMHSLEEQRKSLSEIESRIIELAQKDKNEWAETAELMIQVQQKQLFSTMSLSFTQWVRELAAKAQVNESLLWRRLKAGKFYLRVREAEKKKNIQKLPKINDIEVSPDNFVLIQDIVGNDDDAAVKLLQKLINKQIFRKDLVAMKTAIDKRRKLTGIKYPANAYERDKKNTDNTNDISVESGITAAKILMTLQQDSNWLFGPSTQKESSDMGTFMRSKYKDIYRVLPEFPVQTGDTSKARRIDAMIVENITSESPTTMNLRAIEIKVAKSDLENDQKMSEYTIFADYFYLAVPPNLENIARANMMPDWGLLIIHDDNIEVIIDPKKNEGVLRNESLSTALYEVL